MHWLLAVSDSREDGLGCTYAFSGTIRYYSGTLITCFIQMSIGGPHHLVLNTEPTSPQTLPTTIQYCRWSQTSGARTGLWDCPSQCSPLRSPKLLHNHSSIGRPINWNTVLPPPSVGFYQLFNYYTIHVWLWSCKLAVQAFWTLIMIRATLVLAMLVGLSLCFALCFTLS